MDAKNFREMTGVRFNLTPLERDAIVQMSEQTNVESLHSLLTDIGYNTNVEEIESMLDLLVQRMREGKDIV